MITKPRLLAYPDCSQCPLRHKKKVLPDGPAPASIAIVGEGPGKNEERQGRGFVGASGEVLWQMCAQLGIRREDVWVTNAALCYPEKVRLKASGAVLPLEEVKRLSTHYCRPRLAAELNAVRPRVIIPIGNYALRSLTGIREAKITKYRGSITAVDLAVLQQEVASCQQ